MRDCKTMWILHLARSTLPPASLIFRTKNMYFESLRASCSNLGNSDEGLLLYSVSYSTVCVVVHGWVFRDKDNARLINRIGNQQKIKWWHAFKFDLVLISGSSKSTNWPPVFLYCCDIMLSRRSQVLDFAGIQQRWRSNGNIPIGC